jgi:hypothetical protein
MGLYLEPNGDKEKWLIDNGEETCPERAEKHVPGNNGKMVVILIDNGPFKAAGVLFNERERDYMCSSNDMKRDKRPRKFFLVDMEKLSSVAPDWDIYLEA